MARVEHQLAWTLDAERKERQADAEKEYKTDMTFCGQVRRQYPVSGAQTQAPSTPMDTKVASCPRYRHPNCDEWTKLSKL